MSTHIMEPHSQVTLNTFFWVFRPRVSHNPHKEDLMMTPSKKKLSKSNPKTIQKKIDYHILFKQFKSSASLFQSVLFEWSPAINWDITKNSREFLLASFRSLASYILDIPILLRQGKQYVIPSNLESVEAIFEYRLFDQLENISFWSNQVNTTHTIGTVRSLLWPGYIAYTFFNKNIFGGVYVGNGLKQVELAFYLWSI